MKSSRWHSIACALLVIANSSTAIARQRGGYMGWIAETPISKYNDEDKKLLRDAADQIIEAQPGDTRNWENPKTGNNGKLTLLAVYNGTDGRPCRQVRVQNNAKGLSGDQKVVVCKDPKRGWLLDTQEPPKN